MRFVLKKELLLKYKFWILLGVEPLLILIALWILNGSVADLIAKQRQNLEKARHGKHRRCGVARKSLQERKKHRRDSRKNPRSLAKKRTSYGKRPGTIR